MKTLLALLMGALTAVAALPARAGPDWHVLEQARKARLAARAEVPDDGDKSAEYAALGLQCPAQPPVLFQDRGPRAQAQATSPWNRLRQQRHEAWIQACNAPISEGVVRR
jgi:hypothetical protein